MGVAGNGVMLLSGTFTVGALAVDILLQGKTNRVVGYQHGQFVDFDIEEALQMQKAIKLMKKVLNIKL